MFGCVNKLLSVQFDNLSDIVETICKVLKIKFLVKQHFSVTFYDSYIFELGK